MESKSNEAISHHKMIDELPKNDLSKIENEKPSYQLISELIHTADQHLSIQNEQIDMIKKIGIPKICFISFYPQKNEDFLLPIALHFLENPTQSVLSYFVIPTDPYNIYFECSDPDVLLQNLYLIPQLMDKHALSVQEMTDINFIQTFCNLNMQCYLKPGNFVKIINPEFKGDFGQIVSINYSEKKCYLKVIPRIDYKNLTNQKLVSQSQLNNLMPVKYRPPKSLFDVNKLIQIDDKIKFDTKTIKFDDIDFELTVWDDKKFYGLFQYKIFELNEIQTIHDQITADEFDLFFNNVYLNEEKLPEFNESFEKVHPKPSPNPENDDDDDPDNDDDKDKENHDEEEEINPVLQGDIENEKENEIENESNSNSDSILSDIPKRFPQVSILTNYITLKIPKENFVWLEKTDGIHNNIIIEKNKAYSIINGKPELLENVELNQPEFINRTILDTEFYKGKYYIFDAVMINGEDISNQFFKERMEMAKQLIEKTKANDFIIKEFYEINEWHELIDFIEKTSISPFTGNSIDGVVCQRIDKPYYTTVKDPGCFKLKRKVMITTDFYIRYQENEKRYYLYLIGNYKNYIFNLKQLPKNNKHMKRHTGVDTNSRELPESFNILFSSPYEENLHLFKPRTYWSRKGYFKENIEEVEALMNDMIKNPLNYDKKIVEMSLADDGWVPLRVRNDKTHSNGYTYGITNSSIIFSPVTGEESYFSKKFFFDDTIIDPYHKINQIMRKYIIETSINTLDNSRLNVLDLAGGRGADLLSLFHSGAFNIFAVDADRNALVQYVTRSNNLAKTKWEKLRKSSVDLSRNRKTISLNAVYAMLGKNNSKFITDIKSRYEYPEDGFDVILMNYAIHYLCYSHECIKQLNRFVKTLLRPRGLFVFSCFDGDLILRDMKKNPLNNEIELALNSFNIKLIQNLNDPSLGFESDSDAKWANMALPTIDASGYRPEPLVQRKYLKDLHMRTIDHYYPLRRCEKYMKDIENKEKVIDYLDYIQVYVMEK